MEWQGAREDGGFSLVSVGEGAWGKVTGRVRSDVQDDGKSRAGRGKIGYLDGGNLVVWLANRNIFS